MQEEIILSPQDFSPSLKGWKINGIFNPASIRLPNKKIALFVRIAETLPNLKENQFPIIDLSKKQYAAKIISLEKKEIKKIIGNMILLNDGTYRLWDISHLRKVILNDDGTRIESIEQSPSFVGTEKHETCGVEDPRIVKIGTEYYMTYTSVSISSGVTVSLASSLNITSWKHHGMILQHQNKDASLFPEKINGEFILLHRPEGSFNFVHPSIWISSSKDLVYWGKPACIATPRPASWDSQRIGAGCPPIKTKKGWLCIYHGVSNINGNNTYSAGALLLDFKNPRNVLARSPTNKPLFSPSHELEKSGFVNHVVFPTGIIEDKDNLIIYSGAADKHISVRKISLQDIFKSLKKE